MSHKGLQANAQSEQFSHATKKQHKTADSTTASCCSLMVYLMYSINIQNVYCHYHKICILQSCMIQFECLLKCKVKTGFLYRVFVCQLKKSTEFQVKGGAWTHVRADRIPSLLYVKMCTYKIEWNDLQNCSNTSQRRCLER